jgi:hypothetical protein
MSVRPPRALMVNRALKRIDAGGRERRDNAISSEKPGGFSVNQFLSKPFEFFENTHSICFECAQKPKQRLQSCLLAV